MKKGNRKNLREKNRDKIKVKTFDRIVIKIELLTCIQGPPVDTL